MFPSQCFISPLLLVFSLFINFSGADTSSFEHNCPTSFCNHQVEIKYPFWRIDTSSPQYCGYRGFGINCSDPTKPIIHISNNYFLVKSINYMIQNLTLVDIDVLADLSCPRARYNLTMKNLPLEYSELDKNLTFYYNCTRPLQGAHLVDCLKSHGKNSYYCVEENDPEDLDWHGNCEYRMEVTVMTNRELTELFVDRVLATAISEGFVLDWRTAPECGKCEASDGFCGFDNSTNENLCFCKDGTTNFDHCNNNNKAGRRSSTNVLLKVGIALGTAGAAVILTLCLVCCFRFRLSCNPWVSFTKGTKREDQNAEAFLRQYGSLSPMAYSYSHIKKMTNSFEEKLGEGGYGGVYKGNLNGHPVAVKILKETKGNREEFINEVASISRTSHVNVVTLLGFCLNSREKALIYEFMPNGSLDKHIYGEKSKLGWEMLYKISLGIARGLEYLHRGCNSRILHFDIKPHNILLDEEFRPKISDFGLAKLCTRNESIMSTLEARGTIGYIAPEVFSRNFGGVSHKSDVYSYGMMVLEMVGGRRNYSAERSHHSEIYFPRWAYQRILLDEDLNIRDTMTDEEEQIAKKMILVGLWCIQTDPSQRPAIGKVIEMLEGSMEALEIPPKPFICSPSRSEASSLTNLEQAAAKLFLHSDNLSWTLESTTSSIV